MHGNPDQGPRACGADRARRSHDATRSLYCLTLMSTGRNFAINLGGNLLGLGLFAALTPVYLHAIGPERYGVVAVILSLSTYVATFNFGMGPALAYFVSGELKDDVAAQSEAYWSAMALSMPIGLIASVLIFGLLPLGLAELMHLSPNIRHELRGAVPPLIGIGLSIVLVSNARGVWNGRQASARAGYRRAGYRGDAAAARAGSAAHAAGCSFGRLLRRMLVRRVRLRRAGRGAMEHGNFRRKPLDAIA